MYTISSMHEDARDSRDASLVLVSLVLVLLLLAFGPQAGEVLSSMDRAVAAWGDNSVAASLPAGNNPVFAVDQRYWDANCSHGWVPNSACAEIAQRVQSCQISLASAYCSSYDSYMKGLGSHH